MKNKLLCTIGIVSFCFFQNLPLWAQNNRISGSMFQENNWQEDSILIEDNRDANDIENPIAFAMPIKQFIRINSDFGRRSKKRWHYGVDLKVNHRDTIMNAWNGVVTYTGYEPRGYGRYVKIKHFNGFTTIYGHLDSILVHTGDSLFCGTPVGLGGQTGRATGIHLHFEIRYENKPFNPNKIVDFAKGELKPTFVASLQKEQPKTYLKQIEVKVYRVKQGDTVSKIAQRYDVKVSTLYKLNGFLANAKYLKPGLLIRYQ